MPNVQLAPLIGRDAVLTDIRRLLTSESVRCLTLSGPGGTGKTRVAQAIASEWSSHASAKSVYFVDFSVVANPADVPSRIAQAFGAQESGAEPITEILEHLVAASAGLLVLDNFERVMGAAEFVSDLAASAPGLSFLVTSREPLHIRAERVLPIAPLAMPDAIRLFEDRGRARQPDFSVTPDNADTVGEICRRLDGLPLAIELAAAQVGVLSPATILARLKTRAPFVLDGARDLPVRHRTLSSTVGWSYDLLDAGEQLAFRRSGVFTGTFSLGASEALVSDHPSRTPDLLATLARLSNKSLVQVANEESDEPRFRLLETIRMFALEMLDQLGELHELRCRHAEFFAETAEQAEEQLVGPSMAMTLQRLELDYDNFRSALAWSLDTRQNRDLIVGLRLAGALHRFWMLRGHLGEARQWLERALDRTCEVPAAVRAKALNAVGVLAGMQGDNTAAEAYFRESFRLWESVGEPIRMAAAMGNIGLAAQNRRNLEKAIECFRTAEALYATGGNQRGVAVSIGSRANLARQQGHTRDAVDLFRQALVLFREVGDPRGTANSLASLGQVLVLLGQPDQAIAHFREALELRRSLGNTLGIAECLEGFAAAAAARRQGRRAARLLGAAAALRESTGAPLPAQDRDYFSEVNQRTERQLLPEILAKERAIGRALSANEAIDYALRDDHRRARGARLSQREWEVAELVAGGRTNRQIATTLHLSRRTVGTHLEHIFSKLGFQNRSELAVWIARQPEVPDRMTSSEGPHAQV